MNNTFQLVDIGLIHTVGLTARLTQSQHENFGIVSRLWKRFNADIHTIGNRPASGGDWEKFGITYRRMDEYCYLAAIRFENGMVTPLHMTLKDIAPGRYACFTHTGKLSRLKSTIYDIYKITLPASNLKPASKKTMDLIHFEKYDNRFHWNRSDSIIEIYVPMETGAETAGQETSAVKWKKP